MSKIEKSYFESGKEDRTERTNAPISSVVKKIMMGAFLSFTVIRMMKTWYEHCGLMSLKTVRLRVTKVNIAPFSPNLMVSVLYQERQKGLTGKKRIHSFTIIVNDVDIFSGTTIFDHDLQSYPLIEQRRSQHSLFIEGIDLYVWTNSIFLSIFFVYSYKQLQDGLSYSSTILDNFEYKALSQ